MGQREVSFFGGFRETFCGFVGNANLALYGDIIIPMTTLERAYTSPIWYKPE